MNTNMIRIKTQKILFFFLFSIFIFHSCAADSEETELKALITTYAKDSVITGSELEAITTFIETNITPYHRVSSFIYTDNTIDSEKLKKFIQSSAKKMGSGEPSFQQDVIAPIKFKFYLESSVSVHYYEGPNTTGEFRGAINRLLNEINRIQPVDNLMYIVNTSVHPYQRSFNDFIQQSRMYNDDTKKGDPSKTDFRKIFENILSTLNDNEVSIMVSDMVYSTPNMNGRTTQMIATEVEALTQSVFNSYAKDVSMLIVKLNASYDGKYFFFDPATRTERNFPYQGSRPYYLTFYARTETMEKFLFENQFKDIRNFSSFNGFEDFYLFKSATNESPYYSILLGHPKEKAAYNQTKVKGNFIHSIERVRPDRYSSSFQIAIGVDLSNYFLSEGFKTEKINYRLNREDFEILSIEPLGEFKSMNIGKATHIIIIKSRNNTNLRGSLTIEMMNNLASWIHTSSTLTDSSRSIPNFAKTTFVLEEMLTGIHRAYNNNEFFKLEIELK